MHEYDARISLFQYLSHTIKYVCSYTYTYIRVCTPQASSLKLAAAR